jgi:RNA polymerase sigma factor (sigma-70 family)
MPFEATVTALVPAAVAPAPSAEAHDDTGHARGARALDALAVRAQSGDNHAVDELLAVLATRLRRLVGHRVLAKKGYAFSEADVEDALHDVLLHIWQHDLPMFDPARSGFLTFVSRRIDWHVADRARKARRLMGEEVDDEELELVIDEGRDPESLLAAAENERTMLHLGTVIELARTDDTARTVIKRHDLEGATLVDVAKELSIHVSNACRARQRGLRHLTRQLGALAA